MEVLNYQEKLSMERDHREVCMVKIEAIVKWEKMEEVQKALLDVDVKGVTVIEVKGFVKRPEGPHGVIQGYRD